jgi:hypothetical protein
MCYSPKAQIDEGLLEAIPRHASGPARIKWRPGAKSRIHGLILQTLRQLGLLEGGDEQERDQRSKELVGMACRPTSQDGHTFDHAD